jgi:hypothetical protein
MISVIYSSDRFIPVIICDQCGERITDAKMAAAVSKSRDVQEGEELKVAHVHKGACQIAVEAQIGSTGWSEMMDHILHLCTNIGLSLEDLIRRRDFPWV